MAALPWLLRRWQQRQQAVRSAAGGVHTQVLSSAMVGPNLRVVAVEVGQGSQATRLVLGVTPQAITCLHVLGSDAPAPAVAPASFAHTLGEMQHAGTGASALAAAPAAAVHKD